MKKFNNKSGFTLIEIIVVLIIVGILAAIALPNLFSNVNKSRAEEALGTISTFRPLVEACIVGNLATDNVKCSSAVVDLGNPTASTNFTYVLTGPAAAGQYGYKIVATGQGALAATDQLTVTHAAVQNGAITCVGGGTLQGAC
jgi:prepilin-type N-terminal cleavage/methylation domain-containing protein